MNSDVINVAPWQSSIDPLMLMAMLMLAIAWLVRFQCHAFGAMSELYSKVLDGVNHD
jgi:hypothetical protein